MLGLSKGGWGHRGRHKVNSRVGCWTKSQGAVPLMMIHRLRFIWRNMLFGHNKNGMKIGISCLEDIVRVLRLGMGCIGPESRDLGQCSVDGIIGAQSHNVYIYN